MKAYYFNDKTYLFNHDICDYVINPLLSSEQGVVIWVESNVMTQQQFQKLFSYYKGLKKKVMISLDIVIEPYFLQNCLVTKYSFENNKLLFEFKPRTMEISSEVDFYSQQIKLIKLQNLQKNL